EPLCVHRPGRVDGQHGAGCPRSPPEGNNVRIEVAPQHAGAEALLPDQALQLLEVGLLAIAVDPAREGRNEFAEVVRSQLAMKSPFSHVTRKTGASAMWNQKSPEPSTKYLTSSSLCVCSGRNFSRIWSRFGVSGSTLMTSQVT